MNAVERSAIPGFTPELTSTIGMLVANAGGFNAAKALAKTCKSFREGAMLSKSMHERTAIVLYEDDKFCKMVRHAQRLRLPIALKVKEDLDIEDYIHFITSMSMTGTPIVKLDLSGAGRIGNENKKAIRRLIAAVSPTLETLVIGNIGTKVRFDLPKLPKLKRLHTGRLFGLLTLSRTPEQEESWDLEFDIKKDD